MRLIAQECPGNCAEEDRPDNRPESGDVIVGNNRIGTGKADAADQHNQYDCHDDVRQCLVVVNMETVFQICPLLKERESTNQEQVWKRC